MATRPASQTAVAVSLPKFFTRSVMSSSVTMVRCADVWPVSMAPHNPRSTRATWSPADFRRYAVEIPASPPPTMATSTVTLRSSGLNEGKVPVRSQ